MARSFFSYVKAAFNARPLGMPIPPNWVGLAGLAMAAAAIDPGFLLIGAGLELAYLLGLASSKRFQRVVDAKAALKKDDSARIERMLQSLPQADIASYALLRTRCREILQEQQAHGADITAQNEALSRLLLVDLQLLVTRQNLRRMLSEARQTEDLPLRIASLQQQLEDQSISTELRNSLEGQKEILEQRLAGRNEGAQKLDFVEAELTRIREQIELVREQSALSSDATIMTERIDAITGSLTQTGQWIRQQQQILGRMEDLSTEAPPLMDEPPRQRA